MISIFAKPPFWIRHLQRVSSMIRGEQIAAYMLGCRLNPPSGYEDDICIYVKPYIGRGQEFKFEKRSYIDLLDAYGLTEVLNRYPEVSAITFSDWDYAEVSKQIKNKVVNIPHHHVNFERQKRQRSGITRVGIIGSFEAFGHIPQEIRDGLKKRGINLAEHQTFYPRTVVADFYKAIDVQLLWRPYNASRNPFKIVNASAFGVPTIALDEPWFNEMDGCYIPVKTPQEWLEQLDILIGNQPEYNRIADICLEKSEKYHIENIVKLYEALT